MASFTDALGEVLKWYESRGIDASTALRLIEDQGSEEYARLGVAMAAALAAENPEAARAAQGVALDLYAPFIGELGGMTGD